MKQLDRRTVILLGVLGALVVAFLVWKVMLSGGGDGSTAVQDPATVTTVVGAQAQTDGTGTGATTNAGSGRVRRARRRRRRRSSTRRSTRTPTGIRSRPAAETGPRTAVVRSARDHGVVSNAVVDRVWSLFVGMLGGAAIVAVLLVGHALLFDDGSNGIAATGTTSVTTELIRPGVPRRPRHPRHPRHPNRTRSARSATTPRSIRTSTRWRRRRREPSPCSTSSPTAGRRSRP